MKYPELTPALKYIEDEETRKRISLASNTKCKDTNIPILEQLI